MNAWNHKVCISCKHIKNEMRIGQVPLFVDFDVLVSIEQKMIKEIAIEYFISNV